MRDRKRSSRERGRITTRLDDLKDSRVVLIFAIICYIMIAQLNFFTFYANQPFPEKKRIFLLATNYWSLTTAKKSQMFFKLPPFPVKLLGVNDSHPTNKQWKLT